MQDYCEETGSPAAASKIKAFRALGTINTIQVFDAAETDAPERAVRRVLELDDRLSVYKPESEISRLNAAAGLRPVQIGADTMALLAAGKRFSNWSDGAFSLTARPLSALWAANASFGTVPSRNELERARLLADDADLRLDAPGGAAMLKQVGQAVDLGGIAKGYAADEVARILREGGVTNAIVNLGGTVIAMGKSCIVGIQHPDRCTGIPMGRIALHDRAVVTSGDYERYFEVDGERYHHILDPRTGYPAKSGLRSVTVIGGSAMVLDALSTAIFVMGTEKGLPLARRLEAEAILVTGRLDVYCSRALRGGFSLLSATQNTRVFG